MNDPMPAKRVDTRRQGAGLAWLVARFLARGLEGPKASRPTTWDLVRALALVGFVVFAAIESLSWLHLNITKQFKNESINVRSTYDVSPVEQDVALLMRWLPSQGKVGYLSEKQGLPHFESKLRLAPLLLDSNWKQRDWVLVDYPVRQGLAEIQSPRYQLVAELPDAKAFARGMRIYKRKP